MNIITLSKAKNFSIRINFDFRKITRKNICNTTFLTYKISNSVENSDIFFRTK